MSTYDCYALAEALLAGDRGARWVLVDCLIELGDVEEANFIRRASSSRAADLDVAIRQLPCPHVIELGCDFLEHCTDHEQPGLYSLLGRVRRLVKRGGSSAQFAAVSRSLAGHRSFVRDWYARRPLDALDDAVHSFSAAVAAAEYQADDSRAVAIAVAATARWLRAAIRQETLGQKHADRLGLGWQIKRTRELLVQLALQSCSS